MLNSCPLCGLPLKTGNVKRERRPGKKSRRIHRVCPSAGFGNRRKFYVSGMPHPVTKEQHRQVRAHLEPASLTHFEPASKDTISSSLLPQNTETPSETEKISPYRYFIRKGDIDRIKRAALKGVSLQVEIYSVHESFYETNPEYFNEHTEIKLEEL